MGAQSPVALAQRVPVGLIALVAATALGIGVVVGYQWSVSDQRTLSVAGDDQPGNDDGGAVVVNADTTVIRTFVTTVGEELALVDVPHYVVESWGDALVSSDTSVVEVIGDVSIRATGVGVAELGIRTDGGSYRPLYRTTVTE